MQLLFIQQWLTTELMQALCWSLVHSLWQGLALAIVAGIIILVTKRSGPVLRYNLLSGLFLLFMIVVSVTFVLQLQSATAPAQATPANRPAVPGENFIMPVSPAPTIMQEAVQTDYLHRFVNYFNEHATLIVALWFIIFSAKFVRIVAGLGYIQRIRHYKTHTPPSYWINRLETFIAQLRISAPVRLLESGIVKVPVVTGFLKPIILMPLGMLANIPAEQTEAILLHELAHIKRKDYFINLLQSFAETLFFFNPAVLWLSALIREERENCCDDIAIAVTKSKTKFINALVSFHEFNTGTAGYAMGFPGKKNHLLNRVKRIIYNNNQSLNNTEKAFLVCCFLLTGTLTLVYAQAAQQQPLEWEISNTHDENKEAGFLKKDTIPVRFYHNAEVKEGTNFTKTKKTNGISYTTYVVKRNDTLYQVVQQEDTIVQLRIDEQVISRPNLASHEGLIKQLLSQIKKPVAPIPPTEKIAPVVSRDTVIAPVAAIAPTTATNITIDGKTTVSINEGVLHMGNTTTYFGNGYEIVQEKGQLTKVYLDGKLLSPEQRSQHQQMINKIIETTNAKAQEDRSKADTDRQLSLKESKTVLRDPIKLSAERAVLSGEVKRLAGELAREQKRLAMLDSSRIVLNNNMNIDLSTRMDYKPADKPLYEPKPLNHAPYSDITAPLVDELVHEKILHDKTGNLSIKLTQSCLIVNGVQQSEALHKKFRDKYLPTGEWTFTRGNNTR